MWQIYQCLLLCVTCSILSFFLLPTSVTLLVVCICLALLFMLNDYLLWRYFSVHVASIYYWIVSIYNFLANMYYQSNSTNGPVRKYVDNSAVVANNIGLYGKNNPNPKYNLISSYSLQSESGLSKSFQSPLISLRYRSSVDSSLPESSRLENDSNVELYVPRNVSSSNTGLSNPKYQNLSPVTSRRREPQKEPGLLTPSTRFNLNLNPQLYADINSPGFCGRVAEKLNETMTHQSKYSTVGSFPMVNLKSNSSKPRLSAHNSQVVAKTPVRVRIAPPDMSLNSLNSNILRHTSIGSDESMKSVLQVLREISRKRIHSQENEEDDDNTKRIRKSEFEDVSMEEQPGTDQLSQGKRPREDSPRNEEVKRQRRQFRNNEILSSLSSSMRIQPPHLELSKKRKAQSEELQASVSSKEKVLKFQTTTAPPPTTKQEVITASENIQTTKETTISKIESLHESFKQPITETPKKVISNILPSPVTKAPVTIEVHKEALNSSSSPRLFGRFLTSDKSDVDESDFHKHGNSRMNKLSAVAPKEYANRLRELFSSIDDDGDYLDTPLIMNEEIHSLLSRDKPKKSNEEETKTNNSMSNVIQKPSTPKPLTGILSVPSSGEKQSKSVSFSDPIAITKVISDSESDSGSDSHTISKKPESLNFKNPFVANVKNDKEEITKNALSIGSPIVTSSSNLNNELNNVIVDQQNFSSSISSVSSDRASDVTESSNSSTSMKPMFLFNSSPNNIFKSSPSAETKPLNQPETALSMTLTSSPNLISPFTIPSTTSTSNSQKKTITFGTASTTSPTIASVTSTPLMFGTVATTTVVSTTESPKPSGFSFSPATPNKEPEKAMPANVFGTNTSQSFALPSGNTIFGNTSVTSSTSTSTAESKSLFSTSTVTETTTKPSFGFGTGNTTNTNQNKPMFGTVFGAVSSTAMVADKTSSPFGNVFNSANTTQPNTLLSGFGSGSTTSAASPSTTNSLQDQSSKTNEPKSESSGSVFGGTAPSLGISKPALNSFSFTPTVTTSSNIFSNVFGTSAPHSSTITKPTVSFGGFGNLQTTATTTPLFAFGTAAPSNQSSPAFGSGTTTTTTATPIFNFGSSSTANPAQSSSMFGSVNTSTSTPFGAPQTSIAFGAAMPNSTAQPTAFGINSTQKLTGFGIATSQTAPFGTPTTNTAPLTNTSFNAPTVNPGFPTLTNGTATSNSSFVGFGTPSTASSFAFGGSTTNLSTFSFGGATSSQSSGSVGSFGTGVKPVMFGATPAQPVANSANVFAFGQTSTASPASTPLNFQFSGGATQPSPGGFNFNPAAAVAPTNAFQVGATTPSPATMFTLGSGTARPKAVPRVRRQK